MISQKIKTKHLLPALFKEAGIRQSDIYAELRIEQSMVSVEFAGRGLRGNKNRKALHKYYCEKTGSKIPYKDFWGKCLYISDERR
jgi:hypothetical protein